MSNQFDTLKRKMLAQRDKLKKQADEWAAHPPEDGVFGYHTGLQNVDHRFGGVPHEEIITVAGGPGSGKTAFLTQVLEAAAHTADGRVHLFISAEMSQRQVYLRSAARLAAVDSQDVRRGRLTAAEKRRFDRCLDGLMDLPLLVVDAPGITSEDVVAIVSLLRDEGIKLGIVGIDYIQLLSDEGLNANIRITAIMQRLITLKNEAECSLVLLSQYSRSKERESRNQAGQLVERLPQLSDLRDSGSIEQGSDQVWMFHDPTPPDNEVHGVTFDATVKMLYVRKNRNGPLGKAALWYLPTYTMFIDADEYGFGERLARLQSD